MPSFKKISFKKTFNASDINYKICTVDILINSQEQVVFNLTNEKTGSTLFNEVCMKIGGLTEKDYFGLRYIDFYKDKKWLKLDKPVVKQLKKAGTNILMFRVKHYPEKPFEMMQHELSRYLLYLQLHRDLYCEYILVKNEMLYNLISLAIIADAGCNIEVTEECVFGLITKLKVIKNCNTKVIEEVCKILETFKSSNMDPNDAESEFIERVSHLETYGVEPHSVLDQNDNPAFISLNHEGICVFQGDRRSLVCYWENIIKMMTESKFFIFISNIDNKKHKLGFKFSTGRAANSFWLQAVDQQNFVTLNCGSEAKRMKSSRNPFRRKVTHRFSGRSQKELTSSCSTLQSLPQPVVVKTRNSDILTRSNSSKAICRNSLLLDKDDSKESDFATLPRLSKFDQPSTIISIDVENGQDEVVVSQMPNEEFCDSDFVEDTRKSLSCENELPVIEEMVNIDEKYTDVECDNHSEIYPDVETCLQIMQSDQIVAGSMLQLISVATVPVKDANEYIESEVRARAISQQQSFEQHCNVLGNGSIPDEFSSESNFYDDQYHSLYSRDGIFFLKFVVFTTLVLLFVMITSLVAYYHYRAAAIADLNKQKFPPDMNKNFDLESIKKYILRQEIP